MLHMSEKIDFLSVHADVREVRKYPLPKNHPQLSAKLHNVLWSPALLFVDIINERPLRLTFENPKFGCLKLSFTVEINKRNFHKIRLMTFQK